MSMKIPLFDNFKCPCSSDGSDDSNGNNSNNVISLDDYTRGIAIISMRDDIDDENIYVETKNKIK